jgi:hypothetical protein
MTRGAPLRSVFLPWLTYSGCVNTVIQMYVTSYLIDTGF